jgi:cytoskeletal protein CcmA (bactofilin family)
MATPKELMAASQNTVIGPSILISGKLQGDEDLTVRGRVEGELSLSKTLIVETSGIVKANVSVKNAIISGVVVGNITASESVELTREGRMVGDIHSPRVILVDGASFRGQIDMGEATAGRPAQDRGTVRPLVRPVARPVSTPAPVARPTPPPARPAATVVSRPAGKAPAPPPPPKLEKAPPSPVSVAEGGKKRVVIKKKAR